MNIDSNKIEYEYDNEGKIKKVHYQDCDFFMWNYEPQTKMKHLIFEDYFDKFVKILGKYYNLNYIDGFGGCGAYYEQSSNKLFYGSPILAGKDIKFKNPLSNVQIVVIDKYSENITNLQKVFAYNKLSSLKPIYINGDFDTEINKILDEHKLAPTFFLIDPFGFSIKFSTLKRIMETPRSEIFFNFMYNSVQRFLQYDKVEERMRNLFGCDDFKVIVYSDHREEDIIHLFVKQLKGIAKFAFPYRIQFPGKDMTYYYMIHVSNHVKGISIMKYSYAKFNEGKVEYYGADRIKKLPLFQTEEYIQSDIDNCVMAKFSKQKLKCLDIIENLIDTSEYMESDIKNSIKRLRDSGKIKYTPIPAKTPTGRIKKKIDETDILEIP